MNIEIMEKKNINIWVVRICTILLLTVFTIGRKYGEEQKATVLIENLKQQPCACCLNFNAVSEVAKVIDDTKIQLGEEKEQLQNDNNLLGKEIKKKNEEYNQLLAENNQLQDLNGRIQLEKNKFSDLLQQQKVENDKLNENIGELKEESEKIKKEKANLESQNEIYNNLFTQVNKEKTNLEEVLKNAKINVNNEEYVNFFNSNFAEKKAKIKVLLEGEGKNLEEKICKFYIPFKFKDYGDCFKKEKMPGLFNHTVGYYYSNTSFQDILKGIFLRYGIEQINKEKFIDVKILKEIYFYVKFHYGELKILENNIKFNAILDKEEKPIPKDDLNLKKKKIIVPVNCFSPTSEEYINKNDNNQDIVTSYYLIANGACYEEYKNKILLNYSELIELVKIDEYLNKKGKDQDGEDLFLLELDFKDPECIALLEFVGKGNYGVVKKGLTFENGKLVTKAIKFTCYNEKFENSKEENILKEIRAGKIINEIGVGNKIAFVKDYMKINKFIQRYDEKIISLGEETEKGNLTNAVYTTFLNEKLETLPSGKENVKKDFQNNVFSKKGKIDKNLYIMFMDIVNGSDLFLNKEKNIDINILGKMLFDVLISLYISGVALKDIKPKNIILDEKKKDFSIIDVQTLGKVGRKLTDSCGTPELWPFFKTLNLNLESENEIKNNEIKDNDKKDNDKKDNLYDRFCYSIDDNFVDIYAACMTMYFAKFNTYTAAGLLTLLLKWIILEKETNKDFEKNNLNIKGKIDFLKNYAGKYTSYITDIKNKEKIEDLTEEQKPIKNFFEEIDDKNLNDNQKNDLANLLKQVITLGNKSNIFYFLEKIKEIVKIYENKYDLKGEIENIITFYKECIEKDFKNFASLHNDKNKYADVIKYVLCYGSCLNYNGENKEEMEVNEILQNLNLKKEIKSDDKEFFDTNNNNVINEVIEKLKKVFNQTFIIDLLEVLPLEEYEKIFDQGVCKNSVDYYFEKKKNFQDNKIDGNKIDIEIKKKAFYLLRYLEINRLFHIPKNLLKIHSLINENTDNKKEDGIF